MNWYFTIAGHFLHTVFAQETYDDGSRSSFSSSYDIITTIFGLFGTAGLVAWGIWADGFWGIMRRLPLLVVWLLWPFVVVVLVPVLAVAIPVAMVYSYVRLLPDKETRVQHAKDKVFDLAGRISETRGL